MLYMLKVLKEAQNTRRMKSLCPFMYTQIKMTQSNYIVDSNTKYLNCMIL